MKLSHDLNNLLEDFIDSLQDTYSHTCPTILRTSEKIKLADEGSLKCSWCLSPTNGKLCRRCTLIHGHWKGELPIEHYLPPCFQTWIPLNCLPIFLDFGCGDSLIWELLLRAINIWVAVWHHRSIRKSRTQSWGQPRKMPLRNDIWFREKQPYFLPTTTLKVSKVVKSWLKNKLACLLLI